ncbi:MAG: hypothetical protein HY791_00355 [Deltaproteobacteria bacterium]|nr:hypothetical protein [Deltaproteobacteria bacterium]
MEAVITALSDAVARDPNNTPLRRHLVALLLQAARGLEAFDHCRALLGDHPDDRETLELTARCAESSGRFEVAERYRRLIRGLELLELTPEPVPALFVPDAQAEFDAPSHDTLPPDPMLDGSNESNGSNGSNESNESNGSNGSNGSDASDDFPLELGSPGSSIGSDQPEPMTLELHSVPPSVPPSDQSLFEPALPVEPSTPESMSFDFSPLELAPAELAPLEPPPEIYTIQRNVEELPIDLDPEAEGVFQLRFDVQPLRVILGSVRARATGVLRFKTRQQSFRLHFSEGRIVELAVLGGPEVSCALHFQRAGVIPAELAPRIGPDHAGDSATVASLALESGADPFVAATALREWSLAVLIKLINARSGSCQFVAQDIPDPVIPAFEERYEGPIWAWRQGVDAQDLVFDFRALAEHVVGPSDKGLSFDEIPLEDAERTVAQVLSRSAPVRMILQNAPDPVFRTLALKVIHLGLNAQILKLTSPQEAAQLQQAQNIRVEIRRLSTATDAEILGVPATATREQVKARIEELKQAFASADPGSELEELADAKAELFTLFERAVLGLGEKFRAAERFRSAEAAAPPPPPPAAPPPQPPEPVAEELEVVRLSSDPTPIELVRALNMAPMPSAVSPSAVHQATTATAAFDQMLAAMKRGWHADALMFLEKAARLDPTNASRYRAHSLYCRALGTSELDRRTAVAAAIHGIQFLLERDKPFADAYILQGRLRKISGDRKQSLADFKRALELDPTNAEALREVSVASGQAPGRPTSRR